ncbi:hypothetical protein BS47DRAFT_1286200 [Hydnum rufescens UP504]|uniref:NADP-dependent oxidoreductase domain-containing protein n=1 Tax=Hydnum rufescens UP504 TaxID=1448309 RepID=A0A9P6BB72_9AGAM|nr:hypothetical protein BS47DRAFT_1286200 [Hydnum rufescens UP504]
MSSPRVPLIFGTMTIGEPGKNGVRNESSEAQEILDVFFDARFTALDTARMYGEGTTEKVLSELNLRNATIDTKVVPRQPGDHSPEKLRATFKLSLATLKREKVRIFYLHAPDRATPFQDTLREVNRLYGEGLFEIFGISNYMAWEVAEIVGIAKRYNWVQPRIYQAMYNGITRLIEPELVPCLRKFGINLVVYNPLAGGLFAGKIVSVTDLGEKGGRFDLSKPQGVTYRKRFIKESYLQSVEILKEVVAKHDLRLTEVALRWLQHHSVLTPEDGVILGASSAVQLKQNIEDSLKGPLPQEILDAMDKAWSEIGLDCPPYWR